MKLANSIGTGVQTNVQSKSTDFGIGDPAMLIEIVRKRLYSKPIQTLVQEYISNGRDACREAGLPERLEVTIPIQTNKVFKVRDYGCGISPDRIQNIFVFYGASTKRDDNKQTGGFGIGAKSAWAYTDNFTVISYYNGIARHYVAHLGKQVTGSFDLIKEVETKEPNGTEIQIAVAERDLREFEDAIYRCTFFWKTRPELRGLSPANIPDWYKTPKVTGQIESLNFYKADQLGEFFQPGLLLVIDGIPYPIPNYQFYEAYDEFVSFKANEYICAVPFATGQIEVAASREQIVDSRENKAVLSSLLKHYADKLQAFIKAEFKSQSTLIDFLRKYKSFNKLISVGEAVFGDFGQDATELFHISANKGVKGVSTVQFHLVPTKDKKNVRLETDENRWSNLYDYHHFYADEAPSKALLYNKIRTFLLKQPEGKQSAMFYFKDVSIENESYFDSLVKGLGALPLSSIELDKKAPGQKRPKELITITVFGNVTVYGRRHGHDTEELDLSTNTKKYVWVTKDIPEHFTDQKNKYSDLAAILNAKTELKFCFIAPSYVKKIENDPNFITTDQFWNDPVSYLTSKAAQSIKQDLVSAASKPASDEVENILSDKRFNNYVPKIKDVELQGILHNLKHMYKDRYNYSYNRLNCADWDRIVGIIKSKDTDLVAKIKEYEGYEQVINRYPLISAKVEGGAFDDLVLYLNFKFDTENAKQ